jgi:hypothetical protein
VRARACLAVLLVAASATTALGQESYEASPGLIRVGGLLVFLSVEGPLSYLTLTPKDVPADAVRLGPVKGRGCQFALSTPAVGVSSLPRLSGAAGRGGFEKAIADIRSRHPELRGIYDVKVDDHLVGILGVFQRQCTEVTAQGFR